MAEGVILGLEVLGGSTVETAQGDGTVSSLRVLLLQARDADDPMGPHELACVTRRVAGTGAEVVARNGVTEVAEASWLDGFDALFIGGSGDYSVHHPDSQSFVVPMRRVLEAALARQMPGFGLCFGHQLLGMHLGSEVVTDPTCEEVGTVSLRLTETGRACPLFADLPDPFPCHTGHSDHVLEVPQGVDLLVTGDRTPCQAFQVRGARFFSTQFHPDLTGAEAQSRYLVNKRRPDGSVEPGAQRKAEAYRPGEDITTSLLAQFVTALSAS